MPADATPIADLAPAGMEAWLSRHPRRVTAALLGAAVFVRLLLCLQLAAGPLPRLHDYVVGSDGHFFDAWGRRVAGGEWLQRAPLHPMTSWMKIVADNALAIDPHLPVTLGLASDLRYDRAAMGDRLWDHWLGGATFYQEPAYPYLVGLTYRVAGPNAWYVFGWQLALGVAGVLLVHRLGRRLFSETAAAAAGALAVLAPIPLLYEVTLLRDGMVVFATLALALLMHWAPAGGRRRWLALGLAFGAAALVKQSLLLFPVVMGAWRVASVRARPLDRVAAAGLVAAGMAIALLPAVLRNLAVGAPALAMNGSATAMLAIYHVSSANPFDLVVAPEFIRVLLAADGRFAASLLEAARTHQSIWGFLALNLSKLLYAWHGFEAPSNVDFYVYRQGVPLLATLPATFVVLLPLAGIGVATRRAANAWPLLVAILASVPTLVLGAVLSRYRAPITAALLPLAGAGAVRAASWIAGRRWWWLGAAAGATALYLAWGTADPPGKEPAVRARTYAWAGVEMTQRRQPAFAALCLQESLRLVPGAPDVESWLGQALFASGDPWGALPHLESAARSLDSARFRELYARVLASVGRRGEAIAQARAALSADPGGAGARELLDSLERDAPGAAEPHPRPEGMP
jgi:4-amino-4-deoxy-L-arabinose transferase-like glycosyltransferase